MDTLGDLDVIRLMMDARLIDCARPSPELRGTIGKISPTGGFRPDCAALRWRRG